MSAKQDRKKKRQAGFSMEFRRLWGQLNAVRQAHRPILNIEQVKIADRVVYSKLLALMDRIVASDIELWPMIEHLQQGDGSREFTPDDWEEIRAIAAQKIAPHLSGKAPGSVNR